MQTLGLAKPIPRMESRWRALLWPEIRSEVDFDYISRQGFWICSAVATVTLIVGALSGFVWESVFESTFFFLAGIGARERSKVAATAAFAAYFLNALVLQRYTGSGFGVVRVIFLALLFANIRGNWLSARWLRDSRIDIVPARQNATISDKLADQLPTFLWPKVRFIFYLLALVEIGGLFLALLGPGG
jgi:hypothetical protein